MTQHATLPRLTRRALHVLLAVVALGAGGAALAQQKVLTVGNPFAPLSMDPSVSGNGRAGTHLMPAYEPLIRVRADGSFEAALATAWEMSADSKEATFTLRKDARFSDGEPVTAEAARKSIEYWRNKKGPFSVNLANVTSIDVLDTHRFKIKLSSPNPALLNLFEAYWLSGDLISPKALDKPDQLGTQTFGAGPYKLDPAATVTGKTYTYVPNEHYYDKSRIQWDKIVLSVFEDQNSAIQAMKAGQVKLLVSDPVTGHANATKLDKNMRIVSEPVQWSGLVIVDRDGTINPALKDVRVRQAINHAIDRKLIAKALLGHYADPSAQLQGKGFLGHDPANDTRYPYDPAKAKALLAEAGYATLVFNSNSGVPNLARFQTLSPKGSLNFFGNEDTTLTKLMDEAANLPLPQSEAAWKKVYARVTELAWFAPIAATHNVYFATDEVKTPKVGQSVVIDLVNVVPAK
ncbi:ABC transporter substrate-binding protein [Sphaerotilus sp.]|uniref:ABC transporter substrate-binding protein n=1 Tax=Sphaerotilus sp. TaxID=2093942 RepID=UPI00286DDCC1|nr:ABC transporter substrate-binding protein [Sphaerotilus sp.]